MIVTAVSRRAEHNVSKLNQDSIRLLAGIGVEDDVHGAMCQHRRQGRRTSARSTSSTRSCTTSSAGAASVWGPERWART